MKTYRKKGRPKVSDQNRKVMVSYRLPRWLVDWIRSNKIPASKIIQDTFIAEYENHNKNNAP